MHLIDRIVALLEQDPSPIYDHIGAGYKRSRRADPRWTARIQDALGDARTLVNVGAGTGSYEPETLDVVAVEPSPVMIAQRSPDAAPVVCAIAEQLPFSDQAFDASLAVLTTHHWHDAPAGLREMQRVSRAQFIITWDQQVFATAFWLVRDYLPQIAERERGLATLSTVMEILPDAKVAPLPVPADCADGVLGAFWRRPQAYLSASIRAAISGIALTDIALVDEAMARLNADLTSGMWHERYADLMALKELDLGYRLVVANG